MTKEQQEFLAERLLGWKKGVKCPGCDRPVYKSHDIPCPDVLAPENMVKMIEAARRSVHIAPYGVSDWAACVAGHEWCDATTLSEAVALALYAAFEEKK